MARQLHGRRWRVVRVGKPDGSQAKEDFKMFGLDWNDPQTLWLNLTNLGLGLVTLVCVGAVVYNIVSEIWVRNRATQANDAHAMHVPELGWTMADGGEPLEKPTPDKKKVN